jgi:hypothetical protein
MKAYRIKKPTVRRAVFIQEIRGQLRRPKLPHIVLFDIHKPEVFVEFVYAG